MTRCGGGCTVKNGGATPFSLTCNSLSLTCELDGNDHGSFSDGDRGANGGDRLRWRRLDSAAAQETMVLVAAKRGGSSSSHLLGASLSHVFSPSINRRRRGNNSSGASSPSQRRSSSL
ncbi:hypothetical protein AAHE18_01G062500 [Arachis hypogaea]|nr:uncharacterized protein DS421_10g295420 [Arachis hypogaea]QHO15498.1 uncharacterized protein DS421_10g295430 [Arachis hypogaea]QHO32324.1 uncharacterized protein DS421_8g248810 [Arachis hypogaea]